jgi:predicted permease
MLFHDLRFALRQLWLAPGFCVAVVLTLALGIGVNTAVFSMLDAFLLRNLPYPQPDRIAALVVRKEGVNPKTGQAATDEDDSFTGSMWQTLRQSVDAVDFASYGGTIGVNLKADTNAAGAVRHVRDSRVSAGYFSVLGIPMRLGRSFTEDEDRPNGPPAVIVSDGLWRSTLRADEQIAGKAILLKGAPYTVVGVLPPHAITPTKADLFTPLQPWTSGECGGNNCGILVRLKSGATWEQVRLQLSHVRTPDFSDFEKRFHGHAWIYPKPLQLALAGDQHDQVLVLMVAVSFILLIACANLASLALVRISRRTQEIATRLAVGASGWAVLRQLWIETLVLALVGAAVGVGLAFAIVHALANFLPLEMMPVGGFTVDARALAFTFGVSLLTSILFGALPAMQTWQLDLRSSIVSGSRAILGGSGRLRQWLIGAEVALTVVLLAAAGLMIRTLIHLETRPPGFDPHNVMTAKASLDDARYHNAGEFQMLLSKSVDTMRESLGTDDVAVGLSLPYERGLNDAFKILDGKQAGAENGSSLAYVTPGYFSTLHIPLLSGRTFTEGDTPTSQPVAVVNQTFARRFLGDPSPLGRHFSFERKTYMVVGVVSNVTKRPGMEQDAPMSTEPVFYVPATQLAQGLVNIAHIWFQPSWIVRMHRFDQPATIRHMQEALAKVAPDLPFSGFYSMDQILAEQLQQQRIEVMLLSSLAGLALLLSAVGIYALVSNLVVQRRREIGIRMVLGSTVQQAMVDIGWSGAIGTLVGLAVGIALSFAALRVLSSQVFGVQVYDPVTLVTVPVLLAIIGGVAICLPTLRISRLEPAETLRAE